MQKQDQSTEALFQQAIQAHQSGQAQLSIEPLQQILQVQPDNDMALGMLGAVYLAMRQPQSALPLLQKAAEVNPENVDALANLGIALQGAGQIEQGLQQLQQAVSHTPQRLDIRFNLANMLLQVQRYEEAMQHLRTVLQQDPSFIPAYQTLAAVLGFLQRFGEAQSVYEEAIQVAPSDLQTLLLYANLLADTAQTDLADKAYRQIIETNPQHFLSHAAYGKFLVDIGRLAEGQTALEQAFQLHPDDLNTNILLGNVHKDLGQADEAEKFYRRATQIDPQHQGAIMNLRRILSTKIPFWHFEMLADTHRNDAYEKALLKVIKPDSLVLDIGTGSGLLSMMAARAGAEQVVACEMHTRLAETATEIVTLNGFSDKITVHNKMSTLLKVGEELPRKADIVVSEILDVGALGEGVLPSIRQAVQQLAKPGATLIPARTKLWGQLIEIPARSKVAPVRKISGFDLSPFERFRIPNEYIRVVLKAEKYRALSPVVPLLDVDFYNMPPAFPDDQPRQIPLQIPIEASGELQAVVFWFDLFLDEETMVSSRPDGELEHWGQALFCLPNPRKVAEGTTSNIILQQSDKYISFVLP